MVGCTCGYHPLVEIELKNVDGYDLIAICPKCGKKNRATTEGIRQEREKERENFNKKIKDLEKHISDLQALVEADKGTKPPKLEFQQVKGEKSIVKGKAKVVLVNQQPKDPEPDDSDEEEEPEEIDDLNEEEGRREIADAEVEEREKEHVAKAEEMQTEDGGDFLDDEDEDDNDDDEEDNPDITEVEDNEE